MKAIDIRLNDNETKLLRTLVGQKLLAIHHDQFDFVNSSSQVVAFESATEIFYLYSFTEEQDYFGATEDVAVWSVEKTKYPFLDSKELMQTPIDQVVNSIQLVQENQRLLKNGETLYDVWLTRGIIINLNDRQISFEKAVWFSEEIYIQKGYDLLAKFAPTSNFVESDWEEDIIAECSREIVTL